MTAPVPVRKETAPTRRPINPFDLMKQLSTEMDRVFTDFGWHPRWPFAFTPQREEALWMPELEIEQKPNQLLVRVDLPGLTKENVNIEVNDTSLTIEGERKHEEEKKEEGFYRSERSYGKFSRTIPLPEGAKPETAKAEFTNGVLEIAIELTSPVPPANRRVEIGGTPR